MIYNSLTNFSKIIIIIGSIAWGIYGAAKINIFKRITGNETILKIFYILIGVCGLFLMFNRNFYLPFLDKTVVPFSLMKKQKIPKDSTISIKVNVPPYSRVIYWAAEPLQQNQTPERCVRVAYSTFDNSGITTADENGNAYLVLRMPDGYTVKKFFLDKHLRPHVHYRYSLSDGMLSEIFTKNITSVRIKHNPIMNDIVNKFDDVTTALANKNSLQVSALTPTQQTSVNIEAMTQDNIQDNKIENNIQNNLIYENDPTLFDSYQQV
jgi:uncharacterized membrane protein YuzA (DUF378 family)